MSVPQGGTGTVPNGQNDARQASIGPRGELLTAALLPELAYAAGMGIVYSFSQVIAGVAPGTSGTTTTPNLTIYNGATATAATKVLLIDLSVGYVSGTIGAGHLGGGLIASAAAPTGGTNIVTYPMGPTAATGASVTTSVGTGHTVTALSATSDREVLVDLAATLATAPAAGVGGPAVAVRVPIMRWIPPAFAYAVAGVTAAGSTPLLRISGRFMEYPSTFAPA